MKVVSKKLTVKYSNGRTKTYNLNPKQDKEKARISRKKTSLYKKYKKEKAKKMFQKIYGGRKKK